MKPGIKTTEFYLSLLVSVGGVIAGFLPSDSPVVKAVGIFSALLSALGYTAGRTYVKTNGS